MSSVLPAAVMMVMVSADPGAAAGSDRPGGLPPALRGTPLPRTHAGDHTLLLTRSLARSLSRHEPGSFPWHHRVLLSMCGWLVCQECSRALLPPGAPLEVVLACNGRGLHMLHPQVGGREAGSIATHH